MRRIFTLAVLAAACISNGAIGSELAPPTVGGLASECRPIYRMESGQPLTPREETGLNLCFGFIAGASEAVAAIDGQIDCAPQGVNVGQRAKILVRWADEDPGSLSLPRASGLALAMMKQFPCP